LAAYTCAAAPACAEGPPLPAIVTRPWTRSVGAAGIGSGFQRIWFGDAGTSSNALTIAPASSGSNGRCIADGRIRYSHERRLSARGAVNAVPLSCSA
jgi:hypothetical protein